jgi:hypothetical protein
LTVFIQTFCYSLPSFGRLKSKMLSFDEYSCGIAVVTTSLAMNRTPKDMIQGWGISERDHSLTEGRWNETLGVDMAIRASGSWYGHGFVAGDNWAKRHSPLSR